MPEARLNLGCGENIAAGWVNCDRRPLPGLDVCCDVLSALPFESGRFTGIAAIHLLQDLEYGAIAPCLAELRRILAAGGTLRLAVPDVDRAITAYQQRDAAYFYVGDADARSIGAKFVTQLVWYGSVRTPCNYEFLAECLTAAGFAEVRRCRFGETASGDAALATLDNRPRESLFVEARR